MFVLFFYRLGFARCNVCVFTMTNLSMMTLEKKTVSVNRKQLLRCTIDSIGYEVWYTWRAQSEEWWKKIKKVVGAGESDRKTTGVLEQNARV